MTDERSREGRASERDAAQHDAAQHDAARHDAAQHAVTDAATDLEAPAQSERPAQAEVSAPAVMAHERRLLAASREAAPPGPSVGLAISGGGIRSASFGLGVLQALDQRGVFTHLDYLSTVSGGGYIGSSLTWFLHQREWNGADHVPAFPFSRASEQGTRLMSALTPVDFIRQHGDYLTPANSLSLTSFVATVLRNTAYTACVYFALLVGVIGVLLNWNVVMMPMQASFELAEHPLGELSRADGALGHNVKYALGVSLLQFVLVSVVYAVASVAGRAGALRGYRFRTEIQQILGWVLVLSALLTLVASLPIVHVLIDDSMGTANVSLVATGAGTAGALYELLRRRLPQLWGAAQKLGMQPGIGSLLAGSRVVLTTFVLVYGLLLGAYLLAESLAMREWYVAPSLIGIALALGCLVNANYFGIGRMYRDRLMETFMPDPETLRHGNWALAAGADRAKLSEMCRARPRPEQGSAPRLLRPYHLVNCNVVLVDSENVKYRARGGDSFLLSPLYCGSDSTSWYDTRHFLGDGMTLSTAMSISGGAANPNTGVAGQGPTRERLVSFLMGFFGIRLGYWARNPAAAAWRQKLASIGPNLIYPGLAQGLFGQRLNAKAGFLELSDGGHFENLGLYELARRKLDVIIVSDAAADKDFAMGDLGNAIERVRVDFGYDIRFKRGAWDLQWLMPGSYEAPKDGETSDGVSKAFAERFALAKRGFALGTIDYGRDAHGKAHVGILLYLKATLVQALPGDVYAYKRANPDFPHQSTGDQFFDERQLESYRELGFQLADRMLEEVGAAAIQSGVFPPELADTGRAQSERSGERRAASTPVGRSA